VKWTRGTQNDDVVDVRNQTGGGGGGGGMKLGAGGLVALLLVYGISRALGIDLTGLVGGGNSGAPPESDDKAGHPRTGPDPDADLVDFIKDAMTDIQSTWDAKLPDAGAKYRHAKLYIFTNRIQTKCGNASAAIGPFYCPGDEHAYIDLTFYKALRERFHAPGDFAEVYVLAHEIGHHVQKLLDADRKVKRAQPDETDNRRSVRIELQADCYAGVWAYEAKKRGKLEVGDPEEALNAASAIGDDRLQHEAGRRVDTESFTHGSSEQRVKWFRRGFDTGRVDQCDTISGDF
jgi:predicted metalloprotease